MIIKVSSGIAAMTSGRFAKSLRRMSTPASHGALRTSYAAPLATLVILTLAVAAFSPSFVKPRSLVITADAAAPILLLALGETIVILLGSIDLSLNAIASLSSVAAAMLLDETGRWAVPLGVAVGIGCGLFNGLVYTGARIPSFIATLGTLGIWTGISLTVSGARPVPIPEHDGLFGWIAGDLLGFPNTALLGMTAVASTFVILRYTPLGRYIYAIGIGEPATWLSGVAVQRHKIMAFALAGGCAGLAGMVLTAQLSSGGPSIANNLLLPAIAAVIVGGTAITGGVGGVLRTLIGALIIIVARIGMDAAGVNVFAQQVVYGGIVILAVTLTIDRTKILTIK